MRGFGIDGYGALEGLTIRELERPEPGRGEALVRVHAAALNPADWKVLTGKDGGKFLHAKTTPLVMGFDFSGVVEKTGPDTRGVREGDALFGFLPYSRKNRQGSFAEYVAVPVEESGALPDGVSHVEAACAATTGSTALQALREKAQLRRGQRVLVHGASGGVGSYAVQIAKLDGAEVWGTCSASKASHVENLGADRVVDYRATKLTELDQRFDVVLDAASTSSFAECSRILEPGGAYVTLLPSLAWAAGKLRALFSARSCHLEVAASRRSDLTQLGQWMAANELRHPIDQTFAFESLPDAFRRLNSGEARGKVALEIVS